MEMDTPDRSRNTAAAASSSPFSKVEDSPVFNYINNLSPIQPLNSINTENTFESLNFSSPPSLFSSPHISTRRESRFLRRHHFTNPSKYEFSDPGNEINASERVSAPVLLSDLNVERQECSSPGSSAKEIVAGSPDQCPELTIEFPKTLRYNCGSPDCNVALCDAAKVDAVPEMAGTSESLAHVVKDGLKERHHPFETENELDLDKICQTEPNKEVVECDWITLISNADDLLNNDSPITEKHSEGQDHGAADAGTVNINELEKLQSAIPMRYSGQHEMEELVTKSGKLGYSKEIDQRPEVRSNSQSHKLDCDSSAEVVDKGNISTQSTCKPGSLQNSIRRRCLVFEVAGAYKRKSISISKGGSSISLQAGNKVALTEKQLIKVKNDYSSSMVPGIGLHLNAVATMLSVDKVVKCETLTLEKQLTNMPKLSCSNSTITDQNSLQKSLTPESSERELVPLDTEIQVTENASQTTTFGIDEEYDKSSPAKKRQELEHVEENIACKRCNCKRSKCLKLYCECFAASLYCVEPCSCQDCFNKPIHEDTVMETRRQIESRNPLAFAPKVIRASDAVPEFGDESNKTPASARHKRGCNCRKSGCLKKYCECFQGGVGCSINCRCEGCKNVFGLKDGFGPEETKFEGEESEACEKTASEISSQTNVVMNGEDDHLNLPINRPYNIGRPPNRLPFSFSGKLQGSLHGVGSAPHPQPCTSQKPETSAFSSHLTKFASDHP